MKKNYSVFNKLAMEKRIKCNCNVCEMCQAKQANFLALMHLSSLMQKKEITFPTVIANKLLNPGEEKIENMVDLNEQELILIEKLRNCKNKKEVEAIIP